MPEIRIIEKKDAQTQTKPVVIFCIPGSNFSGTFLKCWTDFLMKCIMSGIQPILSNAEDAVVFYVRNKCLGGDILRGVDQKPFDGKLPYTHMMWIDSDIIFTFEQFAMLMNRNLPIVAGLYKTADAVTYPVVMKWDNEFFLEHGYFKFLQEEDIKDKKEPFEVVYTGFGFLLAKYGVFESLEYPWFRPVWQKISDKIQNFS